MTDHYEMEIAGVTRQLPLCSIGDNLQIAAFIMFGDVELTVNCAKALLQIAPEHDILVTAEAKGIPLICEMARQEGVNDYVIARKGPKLYMKNIVSTEVDSITTAKTQTLCIGERETNMLRGKRVLIVDDVISTGESLQALELLVTRAGGHIVGKMAVLAEGDAMERGDIICLAPLPLFDGEGNPL